MSKVGWGRDLNDVELMFYSISSLTFVALFNISLFRASFTEATLVSSLWPAARSAILGGMIILVLTKVFLWWLFLPDPGEDKS